MGLLIRLLDPQSTSIHGLGGSQPNQMRSATPASLLHYQASINNSPLLTSLVNNQMPASAQVPSNLDWDGATPTIFGKFPYLDNLPG